MVKKMVKKKTKKVCDTAENILILFLWILLLSVVNVAGRLEARYFPVIENVSVELYGRTDGESDFWLSFTKVRDCSYRVIDFEMIEEENGIERSTTLETDYEGKQLIRKPGDNRSGNWKINAPIDDLSHMRFTITHRCHILYDTLSVFEYKNGEVTKQ